MRSILTSIPEPVQRLALALESVHHVGGHDGLPLGVLGVGHRVPHHVLQEHAQHRADLKQERVKTLFSVMSVVPIVKQRFYGDVVSNTTMVLVEAEFKFENKKSSITDLTL